MQFNYSFQFIFATFFSLSKCHFRNSRAIQSKSPKFNEVGKQRLRQTIGSLQVGTNIVAGYNYTLDIIAFYGN